MSRGAAAAASILDDAEHAGLVPTSDGAINSSSGDDDHRLVIDSRSSGSGGRSRSSPHHLTALDAERDRIARKHAARSGACSGCDAVCCGSLRAKLALAVVLSVVGLTVALCVYFFVCFPDYSAWSDTAWPSSDSSGARTPPPVSTRHDPWATPPNTRLAFVGDTNLGARGTAVYRLIRTEHTTVGAVHGLVVAGDLDYQDDPGAWHDQLVRELTLPPEDPATGVGSGSGSGVMLPVFVAAGNHDACKWPAYQQRQLELWALANVTGACDGLVGVHMTCVHRGLLLSVVAPGVFGADAFDYAEYVQWSFQADARTAPALWKHGVWHKNQRALQTGSKPDEVGWRVYQHCLDAGALAITGHEHLYARSVALVNAATQQIGRADGSTARELTLRAANGTVPYGQSVVVVTGIGGKSVRPADGLDDDTERPAYWAATYNAGNLNGDDSDIVGGVLFCTYHVDHDPTKARCEFKVTSADGTRVHTVDAWTMYSRTYE